MRKPTLHLLYIGFNLDKKPFTHTKVRQAFNYAINKAAIVQDIRKGNSIVAKGILPPGMPGYNPELLGYDYNTHQAKQLLAEAGYPEGQGLPVIDLWYNSKEETALKELEAYQRCLAELGVRVEIHEEANWPTFKAMLDEGKPLMFRLGWHSDIPDPTIFSSLFSLRRAKPTGRFIAIPSWTDYWRRPAVRPTICGVSRSTGRSRSSPCKTPPGLVSTIRRLNTSTSHTSRGSRSMPWGPPMSL